MLEKLTCYFLFFIHNSNKDEDNKLIAFFHPIHTSWLSLTPKHWKKWKRQKSLVVPFSFLRPPPHPSWRQTNSPLLAHFISFRGYRTDWVSTVVAIEAYGSKATVEENLRGSRCNRKDQNNSAGLTRGTIQFVMWNHGVSVAQWERVPGEMAQQSACE